MEIIKNGITLKFGHIAKAGTVQDLGHGLTRISGFVIDDEDVTWFT